LVVLLQRAPMLHSDYQAATALNWGPIGRDLAI